jgi:hypothetical protein
MHSRDWAFDPNDIPSAFTKAGFRFGDKGTHTSRTMMLAELRDLFAALPADAHRDAYETEIIDHNVLGKATAATRRLTNQRLGELYGLDPKLPLFRVLRHLWAIDEPGQPLLALLCAIARDPLLRSTASVVLDLPVGAELVRATFLDAIREAVGSRLNEAVLDKVARNSASSWSQSGHLVGRVRKLRKRVTATPGSLALAIWMGSLEGLAGERLLESRWASVLDRKGHGLVQDLIRARQLGLLHARVGGGVIEIGTSRLDAVAMGF